MGNSHKKQTGRGEAGIKDKNVRKRKKLRFLCIKSMNMRRDVIWF